MSPLDTTGGNGKGGYANGILSVTEDEYVEDIIAGRFIKTVRTTCGEEQPSEIFKSEHLTGEEKKDISFVKVTISNIIKESIELISDVLEIHDFDIIESLNKFSLFEEKVKSIWEHREETNENFRDILVHLFAAVRNSHFQKYDKIQYKAIKIVLENLQKIDINKEQVKELMKLLKESKIDLYAPVRNWQNYSIEIKKNE